jgi:hypothetical protein
MSCHDSDPLGLPSHISEQPWKCDLSTPFQTFFDTNGRLTTVERRIVKTLIQRADTSSSTLRRSIEHIQDEIKLLQEQMHEQKEHLSDVLQHIKRHEKLVNQPIMYIPSEILLSIFGHLVDDITEENPSKEYIPLTDSLSLLNSVWVVSQVCQSWRLLAISYSSLWSQITLARSLRGLEKNSLWRKRPFAWSFLLNQALYRLGHQLVRSRRSPLQIYISTRYYKRSKGWPAEVLPRILELLGVHHNRWQHAILFIPLDK